MGGASRREGSFGSGDVAGAALVEEEEVEMEDEDGGGRGLVASGEALVLPSVSEERAEDRDGGCRYLPPPSLQLVTSEHTDTHEYTYKYTSLLHK